MKIEVYYSKASRKFLKLNESTISQVEIQKKLSDAITKRIKNIIIPIHSGIYLIRLH